MNKRISFEFDQKNLNRLPKDLPFIVIGNQMMEGLEATFLLKTFENAGRDIKILSAKNTDDDRYILIRRRLDPTYFSVLEKQLIRIQKEGISTVLLLNFSGTQLGKRTLLNQTFKLIKNIGLPIIPMRFHSDVHPFFQSGLRSKIMMQKQSPAIKIQMRIGSTISVEDQLKFKKDSILRKYVQSRIYSLGTDLVVNKFFPSIFKKQRTVEEQPIAAPLESSIIEREINQLTFENLIVAQSEFDLFVAEAPKIPNVLLEVGRLREISFRAVGEGTGKPRDVDEFDVYYAHLIIWDRKNKCIVGGYRIGRGDRIFNRYGLEGFYINSLFKIKEGLFPIMRKSLELGRSYIVPSYQKKRLPLFLLWKGILYFMLKNPEYRYLFGPVSISKYYSNMSKGLIIEFIKKFYFNTELSKFLSPRKPFKFKTDHVNLDVLLENADGEMATIDNLIRDIEPQHFRIPVLFRQYLKLNARFISFNVDPNFSDCLDGFILLDLNDIPYSMLEALKKESNQEI